MFGQPLRVPSFWPSSAAVVTVRTSLRRASPLGITGHGADERCPMGQYRNLNGTSGAPGFEETGWIVLGDGSAKRSTSITDETGSTRTRPAQKPIVQAKLTFPNTDI